MKTTTWIEDYRTLPRGLRVVFKDYVRLRRSEFRHSPKEVERLLRVDLNVMAFEVSFLNRKLS